MRESLQKPSIAKRLFAVAAGTLHCSLLRSVLTLLVVCVCVTPSLWADFNEGLAAYKRGDYTTALRHWQPLAARGNAEAQYYLGVMYRNGYGVAKDYVEAVKWYHKAAEQGYASAQSNLGFMYRNGYGVTKDDVEAVKWYRKAAEQGNATAQYNLGFMYYRGKGVRKDYDVAAYVWFTLAAAQGHKDASSDRNRIAKRMTAAEIAEAERRVRNWKPRKEETATPSVARQKPVTPPSTPTQRQKPTTPSAALPPLLSFQDITLSEGVLDAEETTTLAIRIKNVGPGDARDLNSNSPGV